jgi:ParB/RepB/Spo0J family partition protein
MTRKRVTNAMADVFGQVNQYGTVLEDSATTNRLSLLDIRPDPNQPRRLLPEDLYEQLNNGAAPQDILAAWLSRVQQSEASSTLQQGIEKLEHLAGTIGQHGLINPITVHQCDTLPGIPYLIITGERRWWAHLYLFHHKLTIKGEPADTIAATIVPTESVRAMQLIENISRDDLTAYERATGLQSLYNELREQNHKATWTQVENLLNISRSYRTRILNVFRLSKEAQSLVRNHGLSERAIRPITDKLSKHPHLQLNALNQLICWQEADEEVGYSRLNNYVIRLLANEASPMPSEPHPAMWTMQFDRQVNRALKLLDGLDDQQATEMATVAITDEKVRQRLIRLRDHLERVLQMTDTEEGSSS